MTIFASRCFHTPWPWTFGTDIGRAPPIYRPRCRVPWRSVNTPNCCSQIRVYPPPGQLPSHNRTFCNFSSTPVKGVFCLVHPCSFGLISDVHAKNPLYVLEAQPKIFRTYSLQAHSKCFSSVEVTCRISPCTFSRERRGRYSEAEK